MNRRKQALLPKPAANAKPVTRPVSQAILALLARAEQDYRNTVQGILNLAAADEHFGETETWNLNLEKKRWERTG